MIKDLKIAGLTINSPLILAPMAGVTNHAFRIICKRIGGVGLVCSEMFSSYAIKFRDPKTKNMMDWIDEERPISAQIFGGDAETLVIGAKFMQDAGVDIIDINFGCPVPKVARSGSGASLLKDIDKSREILISLREAVSIPLTIKTRIGWGMDDIKVIELAKTAEICGVDAITVHGRFAAQGYSGTANWDIIAEVKKSVGIPVIANGDVRTPQQAVEIIQITGCDGIMIGRGALGRPYIFKHIQHYLQTGELLPEPSPIELLHIASEHSRLLLELQGNRRASKEMRGHLVWYLKGMPGAAKYRDRLMHTSSIAEIEEVLNEARSQC